MKTKLMDICALCIILATAIGCILVGAAIGYTIMAIWGEVGKVVLTIELILIFMIVIVKSWNQNVR
ncbi:MAG: hypothetical protein K2M99_01565 [Treponemataceae bacterium]|nr:hypothetical protein [Treponemataceae bacterium]